MLKFFLEDGNYEGGEKWNKLQKGKKLHGWGIQKYKKKKKKREKIAIKQEVEKRGLEKTYSLNLLSGSYQNPVQANFKLCKWALQIWNSFF